MGEGSSNCLVDPLARNGYILLDDVGPRGTSAVHDGGNQTRPHPHVGIDYQVAHPGERQHQTLHQLNWELAWMDRLFNVVVLDVGNHPYVSWILPKRMSGRLALLFTFEVLLAGVFLWNSNWVKIEDVLAALVALGKPQD